MWCGGTRNTRCTHPRRSTPDAPVVGLDTLAHLSVLGPTAGCGPRRDQWAILFFMTEARFTAGDRIRAALHADEQVLVSALARARASLDHRGNRGGEVELAVRTFLRGHLPRKFDVGTGEVIDHFGHRSSQLDVIVLNDDQPFTYGLEQNGMYLAEGVSAVGEVKSILDGSQLEDILAKGAIIRQLRPEPLAGDMVQSNPSDLARFYSSYPYFALALESRLSGQTILERLVASDLVPSPSEPGATLPRLDALFAVGVGAFVNFGDGQGAYQYRVGPDHETSLPGWVWVSPDDALVELFAWLNTVVPRFQRWGSIATPYLVGSRQTTEGQGI